MKEEVGTITLRRTVGVPPCPLCALCEPNGVRQTQQAAALLD